MSKNEPSIIRAFSFIIVSISILILFFYFFWQLVIVFMPMDYYISSESAHLTPLTHASMFNAFVMCGIRAVAYYYPKYSLKRSICLLVNAIVATIELIILLGAAYIIIEIENYGLVNVNFSQIALLSLIISLVFVGKKLFDTIITKS